MSDVEMSCPDAPGGEVWTASCGACSQQPAAVRSRHLPGVQLQSQQGIKAWPSGPNVEAAGDWPSEPLQARESLRTVRTALGGEAAGTAGCESSAWQSRSHFLHAVLVFRMEK